MKKITWMIILASLLLVSACKNSDDTEKNSSDGQSQENQEENALRAVYLKNDYGTLFVDIQQESPFTGTFPQDIQDEDGNTISQEELQSGDVVDIYGNGIMLESYPGQYPGITSIKRVESQNPEYLEKYQEMLDKFCPAPDTSRPPQISVSYTQTDAAVSAVCDQFGYQWESTDDMGVSTSIIADSLHVLQSQELITFTLEGKTKMTVESSYEPETIAVVRWKSSQKQEEAQTIPEGKSVTVEKGEDGFTFEAEPGYVYSITGTWPEGQVEYGFEAIEKE